MRLARPKQPGEPPTTIRSEAHDFLEGLFLEDLFLEGLARSSIPSLDGTGRRPHHRAHDFDMRAASAKIVTQRLKSFALGRIRVAQQQRFGRHDHTVEAVAALRGLLPDEGILHWIGIAGRTETPC